MPVVVVDTMRFEGNLEAVRSVARTYHKSVTRLSRIKETTVYLRQGTERGSDPRPECVGKVLSFLARTKFSAMLGG